MAVYPSMRDELFRPVKIGKLRLKNNVFLAPMAAVNCPAFRLLCRKHGAGLTYTQMIDAEAAIRNPATCYDRFLDIQEGERPLGIQLVGSRPEPMKQATEQLEQHADLVDMNMGCSEAEILAKKAGAFFLKHPEQIPRVVSAVTSATNKPVTAKIRSGWDTVNAPQVAKILEDSGVDAIAVHARTRRQMFTGRADWSVIAQVKRSVDIPIIGNGDVTGRTPAETLLAKCDAVMVGRAAMGNPLVFEQILNNACRPGVVQKRTAFMEFTALYKKQKRQRFPELRQHAVWFCKGVRGATRIKDDLGKMADERHLLSYISNIHP
jgi:tRNA-dihydrouridine synthase B